MSVVSKKEPIVLFLGDVLCFLASLFLMLFIRYGTLPSAELFAQHLIPFSILFVVWVVVFFIAGLYEKHTIILKGKLPNIILNAQIINSGIAVLFFYFIPYLGITPKTSLFIYLIISFILILTWRIYGYVFFAREKNQKGILIGTGNDMKELMYEVNNNSRYDLQFISSIDLNDIEGVDFQEEILKRIYSEEVHVIAIDLKNEKVEPILPNLYNLIFSKVRFIDMYKIYEDIFDRIPLSLVKYSWFLENISSTSNSVYDFLKRAMDILIAFVLGIVSLVVYPFVILAIKLDDRGEIFSYQTRVGQNNMLINIMKFRTMTIANDNAKWGKVDNKVTRVGKFLRKSRIDELPQLWNVLRGDISLIGPRPEFPEPVKSYTEQIPYYNVRHIIKPGLSGWAQLYHDEHPHHGEPDSLRKTRDKLSYDLYYIKNRSFMLDLKIALKTLRALLSRSGV